MIVWGQRFAEDPHAKRLTKVLNFIEEEPWNQIHLQSVELQKSTQLLRTGVSAESSLWLGTLKALEYIQVTRFYLRSSDVVGLR